MIPLSAKYLMQSQATNDKNSEKPESKAVTPSPQMRMAREILREQADVLKELAKR